MRKGIFCLVLFLFIPQILIAEDDYLLPLKENRGLSSVFADHRDFHFHSGIDFKTGGKTGLEVHAVESGCVYRLIASWWGYGKAVYLKHPDGKLTVYAHLSDFSKKLEKLVTEKQLQNRNYKVDFFLEDTVWIRRGEVIGYSGESGSGAPHLHFEIRDESNKPLNPLTNGFSVQDTLPPILQSVMIRPSGVNSHVDGLVDYKVYPLHLDSTEGVFRLKKIPIVEGQIGVELLVYDKMEVKGSKFGVYKLELFLDTVLIFSSHYDTFDFENSWKVELDRDFELLQKKEGEFYKLYQEKGNTLPIYSFFNQEVLNFTEDKTHKLTILAEDASGNVSIAKMLLKAGNKPSLSDILLKREGRGYTIRGNLKGKGRTIRQVSVETSPLDQISWRKLILKESKSVLSEFKIRLDNLNDEPQILRVKAIDDFEIESDYTYLLHGWDKISMQGKQKRINQEVSYFLNDNFWILKISFDQILKNEPEVLLLSGNQKILPLSTIQVNERRYDFVFPLFELYLPGILVNTRAIDIFDNEMDEVKYIEVFIAEQNSKTIVESMDGEAKVEIDSGSVFKNINILIDRIEKPERVKQRFLSPPYSFSPSTVPFARPVKIAISYKGKDCEPSKTGLYEYKENSFKFIGQEIDTSNKFISGRVRNLSTYVLLEDQKAPVMRRVSPQSNQTIKSKNLVISAWIKDELSGIGDEQDIEVLLDGGWLIPEYDPEKSNLISKPLKNIKPGWHQLVIKAEDRMDNQKVISHKFKVIN